MIQPDPDADIDVSFENKPIASLSTQREARSRALHSFVLAHAHAIDEVSELVAVGKAHQEIVRTARDLHADLIVIGVRGRGRIDVTLFGSTTTQVLRRAGCPVITIRSRGDE